MDIFAPFDFGDIEYLAVELPDDINGLRLNGDFDGELTAIERCLLSSRPLSEALRKRLIIERIIAYYMRFDYNTDFDALLSRIQKKYPDCSAETLCNIIASGHVDYIRKGGLMFFQNSAASNIFGCCEEYLTKSEIPVSKTTLFRRENARLMKEAGGRAYKFTVKEELRPADEDFADGKTLRVHLPFPSVCLRQRAEDIKLISSTHTPFISDAKHRTAFFEATYHRGDVFGIEFSYVNRARYTSPDPEIAAAHAGELSDGAELYLSEQYPHVRFTPYLKYLAAEIVGDESNPLLVARKIYDYITQNVKYSYMRDYLLLEDITRFAAMNLRGDCGVQALLFITLCRICKIPARWQSGSSVRPSGIGSHDWAEFFIAPYGWLPADTSFGGGAFRNGEEAVWNHYFGNLDPFRLVSCTDFQAPFVPAKKYLRSDPYDNQNGEAECDEKGLLFDETIRSRSVVSSEEVFDFD